jgi:hypothetical protein
MHVIAADVVQARLIRRRRCAALALDHAAAGVAPLVICRD